MSLKLKLFGIAAFIAITSLVCIGYGNFGSSKISDTVDKVRHETYPILIHSAQLRHFVIDSNNAVMMAIDGDEFFEEDLKEHQIEFNRVIDFMLNSKQDPFLLELKQEYNDYVNEGILEGRRIVKNTDTDPSTIQGVAKQSQVITKKITDYAKAKELEFSRSLESINTFAANFKKIFSMIGASLIAMVVILSLTISIVVRAIRKLAYTANALASGELSTSVQVDRKDEIGQLQQKFDTMRLSLSDHIKNLDAKVQERTLELEVAQKEVQDILDAISQGIFTFNFDMSVNPGHSKEAERIFERDSFGETTLSDILELDELQKADFEKWLRIIKAMRHIRQFRKYVRLVPVDEFSIEKDGEEKIIHLRYSPVVENGEISKIMVLAREVTDERNTERALAEAASHQEANMNRVMTLIGNDFQDVQTYIDGLYAIVMKYQVEMDEPLENHVEEYFREIHTAKGNGGSLGFDRLSVLLGDVEDLLDKVRRKEFIKSTDWGRKLTLLNEEIGEIERLKKILFRDGENMFTVDRDEFMAIRWGVQENRLQGNELLGRLRHLNSIRFAQYTEKYKRMIDDLSNRLGKGYVEVHAAGSRIEREVAKSLDEALVHLVRNAMDHGIEDEAKRNEINKDRARISLKYDKKETSHCFEISDNGRGVDADKVWQVAYDGGKCLKDKGELTRDEKLALIFMDDLSTKETLTEISGRGVGMAAVKATVEKLKGTISIETELGQGTTYRIEIPDEVFLQRPSDEEN